MSRAIHSNGISQYLNAPVGALTHLSQLSNMSVCPQIKLSFSMTNFLASHPVSKLHTVARKSKCIFLVFCIFLYSHEM